MTNTSALPEFYRFWFGDLESPQEAGAFNCQTCFMLKPSGRTRDLGPFKASLKCCTFHPFLPSFTLGALFEINSMNSKVLDRYLDASRLTPLGAFPRTAGTSICETGKIEKQACAFLSTEGLARCTIRDFRPSTCAGYVCRSNRGENGMREWEAWESKVKTFEWTLAHLAGFELGRTLDDIDQEFTSKEEACAYFKRAYRAAQLVPLALVTDDEICVSIRR